MKKIHLGMLLAAVLFPLLVGMLSASLSSQGMAAYESMNKPALTPPGWAFSVAWTILYLLMGLASYLVWISDADGNSKTAALLAYLVQLAMNFFWSIFFFHFGMYLFAFLWLLLMFCIVIYCAIRFLAIDRVAALLLVPYILWLIFAAYLNFGAFVINIGSK